jgi:hypothetical protein
LAVGVREKAKRGQQKRVSSMTVAIAAAAG